MFDNIYELKKYTMSISTIKYSILNKIYSINLYLLSYQLTISNYTLYYIYNFIIILPLQNKIYKYFYNLQTKYSFQTNHIQF